MQTGTQSKWSTSASTEIDKLYHIEQATEDALESFPGLSGRCPDGLALRSDSHLRPKCAGLCSSGPQREPSALSDSPPLRQSCSA